VRERKREIEKERSSAKGPLAKMSISLAETLLSLTEK